MPVFSNAASDYVLFLKRRHATVSLQKMAELNKFTVEHQEEVSSDGDEGSPLEPSGPRDMSSELIVQQVRTVDQDGHLKVVYPSKTDLNKDIDNLTVIW